MHSDKEPQQPPAQPDAFTEQMQGETWTPDFVTATSMDAKPGFVPSDEKIDTGDQTLPPITDEFITEGVNAEAGPEQAKETFKDQLHGIWNAVREDWADLRAKGERIRQSPAAPHIARGAKFLARILGKSAERADKQKKDNRAMFFGAAAIAMVLVGEGLAPRPTTPEPQASEQR